MAQRVSARAIVLDGDQIVLLRRQRPGGEPYWVTPGGGVEPADEDLAATARRETMEELGADIRVVAEVLVLTSLTARMHIFLAELIDIDPARRSGPELQQSERGSYTAVTMPLTSTAIRALDLRPAELAHFIADHAGEWRSRQRL